jgi:hypothetical protein
MPRAKLASNFKLKRILCPNLLNLLVIIAAVAAAVAAPAVVPVAPVPDPKIPNPLPMAALVPS